MRLRFIGGALVALGVALVVLPFAISLPDKASAGQDMIDGFHPIMQSAQVQKTVDYYNKTFVPLRPVATGGVQAAGEAPKLIQALAQQLQMTPAQVQQFLGKQFPAAAALIGNLPKLTPVFQNVPPGLDHYKPLVTTMQANVANYKKIDSLPDFRLFTWFFVIPGAIVLALGGLVLRTGWTTVERRALAAQPAA